jgi:uncharacterized NAD-dependent epimerase/dehydratase family protein
MISRAPFAIEGRPALLLADGLFSAIEAKTAACILRYRPRDVVAVLDSTQAGKTAGEVLGYGGDVPVVTSVEEALGLGPELAVVGSAPRGGGIEGAMGDQLEACLRAGLDVVSGLHEFLDDHETLRSAREASGARVWDIRRPPPIHTVSEGRGCTTGARVVMVVGSDCNVGKMTVAVEMHRAALARGDRAAWAATGQTGMILRGRGVAVDAVVADFVGGATEELVNEEGREADVVFVEGQGSIIHPGYAAVTLGLLYGAMPDCMVLVHAAGRERLKRLDMPMMPLPELVDMYERAMRPHRSCPVVGISLDTSVLDDVAARGLLSEVVEQTGLPVTDAVRFGCDELLDAIKP